MVLTEWLAKSKSASMNSRSRWLPRRATPLLYVLSNELLLRGAALRLRVSPVRIVLGAGERRRNPVPA